jgi:hypothetical protein
MRKSSATIKPLVHLPGLLFLLTTISGNAGVPADQHWDSQFGPVGVNFTVQGVAVCRGKVFVTGPLGTAATSAGNTKVNYIAGFDGTNWFPLNNGMPNSGAMTSLSSDGTNVFAGGLFSNADNSGANNNARWDGTNWFPLPGGGLGGPGAVFKWLGSNLYVGGSFTTAGGVTVNNIARWDGSSWNALGTGVTGCGGTPCWPVACLAFQGTDVYVGGGFNSAGGQPASGVARFSGNSWFPLGTSINGPVTALAFYGSYLYAGGAFTNASLQLTNLARWDGSSWSAVPGGGSDRQVGDFASDGVNLYACGLFSHIGGIAANGVAKFDGSNWTPLGNGVLGFQGGVATVNKMAWQSNQLYVAGGFDRAGNVGASCVARWDGTNWWALGGNTSKGMGFNLDFVQSLLPVATDLYAGGLFTQGGDVPANGIARWDGTNWNPLGGGVTGTFLSSAATSVRGITVLNGDLYAGGSFTNAGGTAASGIAMWDGNNWSPLGSGVDYSVQALAVDDLGYLYVGGSFTNAGGMFSKGFALWDGFSSWYQVGNVDGGGVSSVNAFSYDPNTGKMYLGGNFTSAGGVPATNIAYFDGSWSGLAGGVNSNVTALAFDSVNNFLYVGGRFTMAGGSPANHIARWDGSSWSTLGTGIAGPGTQVTVSALAVSGGNVFVGGNFTSAGGVLVSNIAVWDGTNWSTLGSGIPGLGTAPVSALAVNGDDVFAGGTFTFAGDKPAQFIARWNPNLNFYPPATPVLSRAVWLTNHQFQCRLSGTYGQTYVFQATTNFTDWQPVITNSAMFYDFTDTNAASYPAQFYRAVVTQ